MDGLQPQSQSNNAIISLEKRFCSGDDVAFDEVIAMYGPMIRQLVYRLLGWRSEADDVVQDVFVAALVNRKKFKMASTLKTWFFTIAIHQCRRRHRKNMLWRRFQNRPIDPKTIGEGCPENESLQQEKISKVHQAVRRLPGKYRDVIVLKYLEELPTDQILKVLEIRENTFYTRLSRAKQFLQQELAQYMEPENER